MAGIREGRNPSPAIEPRIPSDVVQVQMRAEDIVDVFEFQAGGFELFQPPRVSFVVPFGSMRERLSISDTRIDEHPM
jgi:hypothetical protein